MSISTSITTSDTTPISVVVSTSTSFDSSVTELAQHILKESPSSEEIVHKIDTMKHLNSNTRLKLIHAVLEEVHFDTLKGNQFSSIIRMGKISASVKKVIEHFQKECDLENLEKMNQAIQKHDSALLKKLLESLPQEERRRLINTPSTKKMIAPLFQCIHSKDVECLKVLLRAQANPYHIDVTTRSNFFHLASTLDALEVLETFLENVEFRTCEYLLNAIDASGHTPLEHAVLHKNTKAESILKNFKLKIESLHKLNLLQHAFGVQIVSNGKPLVVGDQERFMHKAIYKDLQMPGMQAKCFSSYTQEQYLEFMDAFENCALQKESNTEIAKRIRSGKLTIMNCGWEGHVIDLVFRDGYLVICNRGQGAGIKGTFHALKIDLSQVTPEVLLQIDWQEHQPFDKAKAFFYGTLPQELSSTEDAYCRAIKSIEPKFSKVGTCGYAAGKAALRASLALLSGSPLRALIDSKAWATHHRESVLKDFEKNSSFLTESAKKTIVAVARGRLSGRKKFIKRLQTT